MTPTDVGTCSSLSTEITQLHVLDAATLEPVVADFVRENPYADATALGEFLVRRGLLTSYQVNRLLEGEGRGLVLGPYVLAESIGTGSLGTVYLAWGRADRQGYAVKVLPQRSPWNARQARRKLQSLPTEPHPGIVPFIDVGTSTSRHYLVWSYAKGDTLDALIRRDGLLPPARAASIGLQIAQALQYCERHGVYHGLLKPSNVLVTPEGRVRLLDFGLGTMLTEGEDESLVDTLAESNATCNMFDCASPESIIDPAKRSVRGDQYSLGCTLYYGLTGRYPFPDGTIFDKMSAHQTQQPTEVAELNPTVPPGLAVVIDRLMQKSPEARFSTTAELVAALQPLTRQSAIYAPRPSQPSFPSLWTGTSESSVGPRASVLSDLQRRPMANGDATVVLSSVPPPPLAPPERPAPKTAEAIAPAAPTATRPEVNGRGSADQRARPPAPMSAWLKWVRRLAFWRPSADPVACTLLTPASILPGETATLQIIAHHANRSQEARTLEDWRGTAPLPAHVERGAGVGMHAALPGIALPQARTYVQWRGLSVAALLKVPVPADWPPGQTIQGTLTIGVSQRSVASIDFSLPVAGATMPSMG